MPTRLRWSRCVPRLPRMCFCTWRLAGQPTSFRAPGFPLFLAGLRLIFKQDYRPQYVAFCLLGALACGLTYLLARELLTEGAARVAAVLLVFYFPHVYFSTAFFSEVLFVPLVALALWQFLCTSGPDPRPV